MALGDGIRRDIAKVSRAPCCTSYSNRGIQQRSPMRTISLFVFRLLTIRSRITSTVIAPSLLLGFTLWSLGWIVKVKAAPNPPIAAASGYLYVLNDCSGCSNQIFGFAVDETTGALRRLTNGFPVSTGGNGTDGFSSDLLTVDRKNLRLFAINSGSKTVSAFTIDPVTGALTAMFSPIVVNETGSFTTIAAHPSGLDTLLVIGRIGLNNTGGFLASFRIKATEAIPVSPPQSTREARPLYSVFRQDGSFVYVYTGGAGTVSKFAAFHMNASGALSTLNDTVFDSVTENPRGYAIDAGGRLFMANRFFQQQQLRVFTTSNGIPKLFSNTTVNTPLREVGRGVLHPNGKFYLVSDSSINVDLVVVYKFNSASSTTPFTLVPGSPFHSGGTAVKLLAFNKAGKYLFAGNQDTHNLTTFRIDSVTGVLTKQATQASNTLGGSGSLNGIVYFACIPTPPFVTTTKIIAPAVTRKIISIGETAPVTIKVSSTCGTPSGNVTLTVEGPTPLDFRTLKKDLSGGSATFDLVMPRVGVRFLRATFTGSGSFASSKAKGILVVKHEAPPVAKP